MATTISDLPGDMVMEILSRVSLTSLRAVRCTCKTWKALSKKHIFGKTDSGDPFQGFMVLGYKLCSVKLDLQGTRNDVGNLVYRPSINRVRILKRAKVCEVFLWDGLLLCVIEDERRLLVWNPYLRQIRWVQPRDKSHQRGMYGVGYENINNNNRNHKILRLLDVTKCSEIYDFNSNSWRALDVDYGYRNIRSGVSLKGNTYFLAEETMFEYFLLCFDFTAERFGQRLVLPFVACVSFSKTVVLSRVRDEQLAVLHQLVADNVMEFWITSKIEPNVVFWSKFLRVEMIPFRFVTESFFIDEEKKLALVSGFCKVFRTNYKCVYIIEEHGYIKSVELGKAKKPGNKLVFSSYAPSLAQLSVDQEKGKKEIVN